MTTAANPGQGDLTDGEFAAIMGRSCTTHRTDELEIVRKLAIGTREMKPQGDAIEAIKKLGRGGWWPLEEMRREIRERHEVRIVREHGITDMRLLCWFWDRAEELEEAR